MINLEDTKKHVHFVGIGGVGVSAIAEILHARGFSVSGSDAKSSPLTDALVKKGITIHIGHDPAWVDGADMVVYTTAVDFTHPELARAAELDIPCISRPDMLGEVMSHYPISIAVSGAHGKTTTSSMISMALERAGLDPTILIGGEVKDLGSNARVGKSDILVAEACEYKESFLSFHPTVAVLLNIDEDHLDYYEGIDHIVAAFTRYVEGLPKHGVLIYNGDDPLCVAVAEHASCDRRISFGMSAKCDYFPSDISLKEDKRPSFNMHTPKGTLAMNLSVPGNHNILNSMAAMAAMIEALADPETVAHHLGLFSGAGRRFDRKGFYKGAEIVDDYAHHPTEVKATLKTGKEMGYKRVICVFQPHTYTRTLELMEEFTTAFEDADELVVMDIYAAREKDNGTVHSKDLVTRINALGKSVHYLGNFEAVLNYLKEELTEGDLLFTMGAGSVSDLGPMLLKEIH